MMRRLLVLGLILFSSFSHASTCTSIANQINADISRYSTTLGSKRLAWMNLTWLKRELGYAEVEKVSPSQKQYKWTCPEENETYIAVVADNQGRITNVDGIYSNNDGSGSITVCLSCFPEWGSQQEPAEIKEIKTVVKPIIKTPIKPLIKPLIKQTAKPVMQSLTPGETIVKPIQIMQRNIETQTVASEIPVIKPVFVKPVEAKPEPVVKPEMPKPQIIIKSVAELQQKIMSPGTPVPEMKPSQPQPKMMPPAQNPVPPGKIILPLKPVVEPGLPLQRLKPHVFPQLQKSTTTAETKTGATVAKVETKPEIKPAPNPEEVKPVTPPAPPPQKLSCMDVMNQIYEIAEKGGGTPENYVWESLDWFKNNFGDVNLQHNNNISGYEWKCNGESMMYFIKDGQTIYGATKCGKDGCTISYASRVNGDIKGFSVKIPTDAGKKP